MRYAASTSVACIILATKVIKTFYQELADLSKVGKILERRADLFLPVFSWSIFIRAVIDHMICYNLNWPKIKL